MASSLVSFYKDTATIYKGYFLDKITPKVIVLLVPSHSEAIDINTRILGDHVQSDLITGKSEVLLQNPCPNMLVFTWGG